MIYQGLRPLADLAVLGDQAEGDETSRGTKKWDRMRLLPRKPVPFRSTRLFWWLATQEAVVCGGTCATEQRAWRVVPEESRLVGLLCPITRRSW